LRVYQKLGYPPLHSPQVALVPRTPGLDRDILGVILLQMKAGYMADSSGRATAIQSRLGKLKALVAELDKTIVVKKAKDFLLRPASNAFCDVEISYLPHGLKATNPAHASMWFEIAEFELRQAEERLKYVQDMVAKYGANLQAIGV
jgi:hypothetical protein